MTQPFRRRTLDASTTERPKRQVPRLRFSLRALMVIVLILGGVLGYWVARSREQKAAVAAIERAGGTVAYDWEWHGGFHIRGQQPPRWKRWPIQLLGPDYFATVKQVTLVGGKPERVNDELMDQVGRLRGLESLTINSCRGVTDAGMVSISRLGQLTALDVGFTSITAASLKHVADLRRLKRLDLQSTSATDADLAHLSGLTSLEGPQIFGKSPGITDAGLAHLRPLVNLNMISFNATRITSAGLVHMRDMTRLNFLNLPDSQIADLHPIAHLTGIKSVTLPGASIDDAGLAPIAGFTGLSHLNLDRTRITDAGLDHIKGLTAIQNLWLNNTAITDAGLTKLSGLNQVTLLFIEGTRVTDAGVANLQGLKQCIQIAVGKTGVTDDGIKAANANRPKIRFVKMGY